jgi:hypothetical protein
VKGTTTQKGEVNNKIYSKYIPLLSIIQKKTVQSMRERLNYIKEECNTYYYTIFIPKNIPLIQIIGNKKPLNQNN